MKRAIKTLMLKRMTIWRVPYILSVKNKNRRMKTVLITGANKGIGFETAKQLAQLGYFVFLGSRDKAKGLDAINKLISLHFNSQK